MFFAKITEMQLMQDHHHISNHQQYPDGNSFELSYMYTTIVVISVLIIFCFILGIFGEELSTTKTHIIGDVHVCQLLECLSCIVILYGEEVILLQYFQHIKEMVRVSNI